MPKLKRFMADAGIAVCVAVVIGIWLARPLALPIFALPFILWLVAARRGRQALVIAWTGLSTLSQRLGSTSVIIVGIAGVVGVLVGLFAMAEGFANTLKETGDDESAILLRAGAEAELNSGISRETVTLIKQLPGIVHGARDRAVASEELVVISNIPKKSTGTDANVEVRGVGPQVWAVHPNVKIISGRRFRPGLRELIVGRGALDQFRGLDPGSTIQLTNQVWTVVGVFDSGDAHNSELWGDVETVQAAFRRTGFQSVTARLTSPAAIGRLTDAVKKDPRLQVDVETTRDYYNKQSQQLTRVIRILGTGVTVIMAVGAVFAALNTMYSAVAARAREIATMRALGFTSLPVIAAVMIETLLLAVLGGILGAGISYVLFDGYTASTLGGNFSQVVFQFRVTPLLLVHGLQWALAIGFVGGLYPALHAAHQPVTVALREL